MTTFTHHPRPALASTWEFDPTRTYDQTKSWCKPTGFWLSVDGDWRRWCEDDEMGHWIGDLTASFDVDTNRCLWLTTVADLDEFTHGYAAANSPDGGRYGADFYRLDWKPLIAEYAGIIVAPYQWERRLNGAASGWYYPWDCASACIWDLSAVRVNEPAVHS